VGSDMELKHSVALLLLSFEATGCVVMRIIVKKFSGCVLLHVYTVEFNESSNL